MILCVNFFWPLKIICSLILMQNMFNIWVLGTKMWKSYFWKIWVDFKCFWKTFKLILMHFIHEICCFEWLLHKMVSVFQKFHNFRISINRCFFSTNQKCVKIFWFESAWLNWYLIDARPIETKNFQFLSIWPIFFFSFFCIIYV